MKLNNFEIGDTILCIEDIGGDFCPKRGEIYTVLSVEPNWLGFACPKLQVDRYYSLDVVLGHKPNWGIKSFIKIGNPKAAKLLLLGK